MTTGTPRAPHAQPPADMHDHGASQGPRLNRVPRCADMSREGASANDDLLELPDAHVEHATMLTHAAAWVVAFIGWAMGVAAAQWLVDAGAFGVPLTMLAGAAWACACIGMKRGFVQAAQQW